MTMEITSSKEKPLKMPPPGILWHYTSLDVLEHFLLGEIAFSHYKFLNDDSELLYGKQLLLEILKDLNRPSFKTFLGGAISGIIRDDIYLFCLSRDGDNLYQWRSYTPQGGIAVGFDRRKLFSAVSDGFKADIWTSLSKKVNVMLLPCRYSDSFARHVVYRLNQTTSNDSVCCGSECKGLELYLAKVHRMLFSQKNPSFREEREERFVVTGVIREMIELINMKPRILLKNADIYRSISCVRLSPHGDTERNQLLVEMLRDKYSLDFQIERSRSSYNGR